MVFVRINGHDFKYQVEDIIRLFYKNNKIIYLETQPPEFKRGIFISSEVNFSKENSSLRTGLWVDDAYCDFQEALIPVKELDLKSGHEGRKILKREVKRQIYMLMSKYTGLQLPWGMLTGIRPAKIVYELLEKGQTRDEITDKLEDYYMLAAKKAELLYAVANTEYEILEKSASNMISLYIGIPFCTSRCLYCSFTSNSIDKYRHTVGRYIETLKAEIYKTAEMIRIKGWHIQSLYIGGGTPTSIESKFLDDLLYTIERAFELDRMEEYTLEAGRPDSINTEKLSTIKKYSVNRISINPQTMNNNILETIGRKHCSEDVEKAFYLAREMGFNNINMDIIAGLPGESFEMFDNSLLKIKGLGPESLTVHTMAVKRASMLKENIESYKMISSDEVSRMVDLAGKYAESMGMKPYYLYRQKNILGNLENIGYSKSGCESIYNIQIMEEKQTIIALGAGAVTKVVFPDEDRIERAFNVKSVEEYISRVDEMADRKKLLLGIGNLPD